MSALPEAANLLTGTAVKKAVDKKEKAIRNAKNIGFYNWLEKYLKSQIKSQNKSKNKNKNKMTSWLELLVDPDKLSILYPLVQGSDQVIRFEFLEEDFNKLIKEAKIIESDQWIDIPKNNPTQGKKRYQEYYSGRSRTYLEENFSRELTVFGYRFES